MTPYTMEQIVGVMRKVKAGEIRVSDNVLAGWEEEERQQKEGKKRSSEPEVSVWPELADSFLKGLIL